MIDRRNFLKIAAGTPLLAAAGSSEARPNLEPQPDAVGMLYDSTLCVGCQACVFKCREVNGIEVNPKAPDAELHSRNDKLSPYALNVIQVWESGSADNKDQPEDGYAYMKRQCMHCVDPNCVSVCPVSSMKKDPKTGIVTNDPDTCLGCRYCMVPVRLISPNMSMTIRLVRSRSVNCATRKGWSD